MADRYFVGDASSAWNNAGNWASSSGGAGGAGVPGGSDKAVFDGNSPACTVDAGYDPSVQELELAAAFANTLDINGNDLTVGSGGLTVAAGTFTGGSGNATVGDTTSGDVTLSGGTLTAPGGTLDCHGLFITGGTFTHNSGKVLKRRRNMTLSVSVTFNDFELNTAGVNVVFDITGGGWDVDGDFTLSNAHGVTMTPSGTAMTLAGDWHGNEAYVAQSGNWIVEFDGAGAQSVDGGYDIPGVKINKASGTLSFDTDITVRGITWEWVQGTVDHKTFKVLFANGASINSGTPAFNDVDFNTSGNVSISATDMLIDGDLLIVNANTFQGDHDIRARGNVETRDTALSSPTRSIIVDGTGDQTLRSDSPTAAKYVPGLTINKAGGKLTLENYIAVTVAFRYDAGAVDAGGSKLRFNGLSFAVNAAGLELNDLELNIGNATNTGTLVVGGDCTFVAGGQVDGGTIEVKGNLTSQDAAITGTTVVKLTGAGDQEIDCQDLPDGTFTVDKPSGSAVLDADFALNGAGQDLVVTSGVLDLAGFDLTVNDQITIADTLKLKGSETITGTLSLGASSKVVYYDSSVVATVNDLAATFASLTLGAGKTHKFTAGAKVTANKILASDGDRGNPALLRSTVDATQWELELNPATGTSPLYDKVDAKDCDASAGREIRAQGSVDSGNNDNWLFDVTLGLTKPEIGSTGWGEPVNANWGKIDDIPDSISTPLLVNLLTDEPDATGQGSWAATQDGTYLYGGHFANSSSADGDNLSCNFRCPAGTYKLRFNAPKDADAGIVDVDIDAVEKGSVDLYAAAADKLNVEEIPGLVLAAREHTLKFRVDGKNASSSDYYFRTSAISLQRTS